MKTLLVIAMLIIFASTQTTIVPKSQACACSNLLNKLDCQALNGCQWTPSNDTNSTNTATPLTGKCANANTNTTTPVQTIPTFCGSITNGTTCAGQLGCAYLNSTCQIFTGCTAYVKTTHSDCQLISTQCTTDGTQCALPVACSTYTTLAVCVGSQGSITKNCKWTPVTGTATTGTCSDTTCTDAPTTLASLAQCQAFISTCFSTGKGCVATLASCTTYLTTDGCSTRIGLEGKCTDTTPASANCRAQVCTDATQANASSCTTFLLSSTCVFNGRGCVAGPLPACNTYLVSQSCEIMIGSDGKCTTDINSSTNCKLYTCADAPTSTLTDSDCQKIALTCVTNGQGCATSPLQQCSSYTGTTATPCNQFKGINGICKASTTAQCTERTCLDDAAKNFTTNAQCDSYFKGCITKGVGCVATIQPCENYTGTADECGKLIGTNGSCTFRNAGQAAGTSCRTKSCTDSAASTLKTNAECSSYSFQCASNNGVGCIEPGNCDTINQKELCQWKSTCNYNQICLDRSTCQNYSTQTLCIFNTQQYLPNSGTTYYERPCTWGGSSCTDQACPTTSSLKTDNACQAAMAGCLTNGAGCIDISADCTQYRGLLADCEKFKGINQTTQCTQDRTVSDATTACIVKNCINTKRFDGTQSLGNNVCSTFNGCYFDGKENCTNLGCTTYFGNQDTCKNFTNAVDDSNKKQYCWNTSVAQSTAQCTVRQCTDAPETSIDDSTCNTFLPGCVTNGKGCVDSTRECTTYVGGTIDICSKFSSSGKQCTGVGTGTTSICIPKTCSDTVENASASNCLAYLSTCQYDGAGCVATTGQCSSYNSNGANDAAKATICNTLKDLLGVACGFKASATKCNAKSCDDIFIKSNDAACKAYLPSCYLSAANTCAATKTGTCDTYSPSGSFDTENATYCNRQLDTAGKSCGYAASASKCQAKQCTDIFDKSSDTDCKAYLPSCDFVGATNICAATKTRTCDTYRPIGSSDTEKAESCNIQLDTAGNACGYVASASNCSAKSCTDVFSKTNDADCKKYLQSCYLSAPSTCAATKTGTCESYSTSGDDDQAKAALCNLQLDASGKVCGYKTGPNCSAKSCSDIMKLFVTDEFCKEYLPNCYKSDITNRCAETKTGACDTYDRITYGDCSKLQDTTGASCGQKTGPNCSARTCDDIFFKPSDAACKAYLPSCYLSDELKCTATKTGTCDTYTPIDVYSNKAESCNIQLDTAGNACGYVASASNCSAKSCTDVFSKNNDADCKTYLQSCYLSAPSTCTATKTGTCESYSTSGDDDVAKAALCNFQLDASGNVCGYKTGANCSAKSCTDVFSKTNDAGCKAYLQFCYLSAPSTCAATKTGTCESYATSGDDDIAKAALCNIQLDASGNACGYKTGTNCSAKSCTDVFSKTSDAGCKTYLESCYLSAPSTCAATKTGTCESYATSGDDDVAKAALCNLQLDASGNVCGYKTGPKCSAKSCTDVFSKTNDAGCKAYLSSCYFTVLTLCAPTQTAACLSYTPTGGDDASKATSCKQKLDTEGAACGFKTGATKCSAKSCTDVFTKTDDAACKAYLSTCYLSGDGICSATQTGTCDSYTPTGSTDNNKAASCQTQLNTDGKACGFMTGATKCSAKSCTDVFIKTDDAACKAYLPTCYLSAPSICAQVGAMACDSYSATGADNKTKASFCNSQIDTTGASCGFQAGASKCSPKACNDFTPSNNEASCNTYLSSCQSNTNWNCKLKVCSDASISLNRDAECAAYRKGCVTNGSGCLDSALHNCADYKGDKTTCQKFTGLDGPCSNVAGAAATNSCAVKQCGENNSETSQSACDSWYPPLTNGTKKCIWNGTIGCIVLTTCDQINGTVDTCALVQASDSPCSGTATSLPSTTKCVSNKDICNKAPNSFTTDAQCKKWNKLCLSTGFGCISDQADFCKSIVSPTLCSSYKKDQSCELANQCLIKPSSCSGLKSAFECNNTILRGTTVSCGWNAAATTPSCITLTCELLPVTLTTDSACSAALTLPNISCTTNGAGCLTKTICSGYTYASACNTASTTDGKKCIWQSSACRNIVCSDNTSSKSDSECEIYLQGCRTTGTGCLSSFDCTALSTASLCLKDSTGNPCLWYRPSTSVTASCFRYTQCTDIIETTHAACQLISPFCTTDGIKCIAISSCAKTSLQVSCIVGTDGACGYLPASGTSPAQCAPFTNCAFATGGTTLAACQAWGPTCVSNGTSCISQTACTGYLTEAACGNLGTSGTSTQKCIFSLNACRPQVCTDATIITVTAIATHTGCASFPATEPCTTNGTNGCIALSTCSSYSQTLSAACVQGTDGPCFFQTTTTEATSTTPASTTTACRLKQCSDILGTTSASCETAVIRIGSKCVSNGVNCIAKSTCSTYTAREACLGGGSDGICAFTPGTNTTTPNIGTCQLFTACNQANQDQTACNLKSASCYFTPAATNLTSLCSAHNCATKAIGSSCQAVPNFDLSQYQICVLALGTTTCQPGTPAAFSQSSCFVLTLSTYTWNPTTSQCQSCQGATTPNNTNTIDNLIITHGYLVSLLIAIAFMI